MNETRPSPIMLFHFRVLYWTQTEELKWGRPGNEATQYQHYAGTSYHAESTNLASQEVRSFFSHKKSRPAVNIQVDNTAVPVADSTRFLGVTITSDLSGTLISPTPVLRPDNNLALFIGHLTKPTPTHSHLYRCLVLSTLDYCSSVWDPHAKYLIDKLDSVQRLAVKMVTKHWSASSTHMLSTHCLNLCPLQERRWKQKAIVCARILRGCSVIPPSHFTPHPHPSQRLHHSFPLVTPFARTLAHQSSFFISSSFIWNNLPEHVICAPSVSSFKHKLKSLSIFVS